MNPTDRASQRQATVSVLGVLAIPLLSVSSAALVAGPVSSADPVGIAQALLATLVGSFVGLSVLRLARAATWFIHVAASAAAQWIEAESSAVIARAGLAGTVHLVAIPVTSHHISAVSRRGPPQGL